MENNSNKENTNNINVDELLRKKRERNEGNKRIVLNNVQKRNQAIADRHKQNTEELLIGEAQIDLQTRLLDAEDKALVSFNDKYAAMTAKVIESNDAKADLEANRINSAVDVEYTLLEEVNEISNLLPARRSRFTNMLEGNPGSLETKQLKELPEYKSNRFDV
jgi:hypothetical protein